MISLEQKNKIEEYFGLIAIFCQIVSIILVMREMDIVSSAFRRILGVSAVGFVIHHLLPLKSRLFFFVLLSISSMLLVLGCTSPFDHLLNPVVAITRSGAILTIGIILIGICHLPLGFWKRVGLLLVAAVIMGMFRAGILKSAGFEIIWIVLASIFMFRIMIYLYDTSTSQTRPSLGQSLGYFFLMPNVCFTLFRSLILGRFVLFPFTMNHH